MPCPKGKKQKPLSKEACQRISKKMLGNTNACGNNTKRGSQSEEWKRKRGIYEPRSEEHKSKISRSLKGKNRICTRIGYKHSEETKEKIAAGNRGHKHTEETRRKIGEANKGKPSPMKGRKVNRITRRKISISLGGDGDIDRLNAKNYTDRDKRWAKRVYKRDGHTCQLCHEGRRMIHAHHIKRKLQYPQLRFKKSNGITLCKECHDDIRGKEEIWEGIFRIIVRVNRIYQNKEAI